MGNLIVVAEDDRSNYLLLENLLTTNGYEVLHAATGKQCLQLAQSTSPDLILLDMRLPELDGWATAAAIRSNAHIRQMPIIAVSVEVNADDRKRALAAGCDLYVAKPFNVSQLLQTIADFLASA